MSDKAKRKGVVFFCERRILLVSLFMNFLSAASSGMGLRTNWVESRIELKGKGSNQANWINKSKVNKISPY